MITLNSHKQYHQRRHLSDGSHKSFLNDVQKNFGHLPVLKNQYNPNPQKYTPTVERSKLEIQKYQSPLKNLSMCDREHNPHIPHLCNLYNSYIYKPLTNKLNDKWIIVAKSSPTKIPLFLQTFQKWMKVNVHKIWIPDCNRNLNSGYGVLNEYAKKMKSKFSANENPYAKSKPYMYRFSVFILFLKRYIGANLKISSTITHEKYVQNGIEKLVFCSIKRTGMINRKPRANMASPPCFMHS